MTRDVIEQIEARLAALERRIAADTDVELYAFPTIREQLRQRADELQWVLRLLRTPHSSAHEPVSTEQLRREISRLVEAVVTMNRHVEPTIEDIMRLLRTKADV